MKFIFLILALFSFSTSRVSAIVFQPQFKWADRCTQQGTGCFIRASTGDVIGLTCAHLISFSEMPLYEATWIDIRTQQPVATSIYSWGVPGKEGNYAPPFDLRSDYLLLLMEGEVCQQSILEVDNRNVIDVGEPVWIPNKNIYESTGYERIDGTVTEADSAYLRVEFDRIFDLQSRSGTPILSQSTGKVIGILAAGDTEEGKTYVYLTPCYSINNALAEVKECFPLKEIVQ